MSFSDPPIIPVQKNNQTVAICVDYPSEGTSNKSNRHDTSMSSATNGLPTVLFNMNN